MNIGDGISLETGFSLLPTVFRLCSSGGSVLIKVDVISFVCFFWFVFNSSKGLSVNVTEYTWLWERECSKILPVYERF